MTEIQVRLAEPADFAAVDTLVDAAYAHDYGAQDEDADPNSMHFARNRAKEFDVWLAFMPGVEAPVGSITTRRLGGPSLHEDVRADELDLRLLAVSSAVRRQGVGAQLMRFVEQHTAEQGWRAVFLKTAPHMSGAHQLYESLGFERDSDRDGLWLGGEHQFHLLTYVKAV